MKKGKQVENGTTPTSLPSKLKNNSVRSSFLDKACAISQFTEKLLDSYMMRPLFTPLFMACCAIAPMVLTQCGGSSSDAEGLAPPNLYDMVLSIQLEGIANADVRLPDIFEPHLNSNGTFSATTQGENVNMWNGTGTYSYSKTGKNTARLTLSYNRNSGTTTRPFTTANTLTIPDITFDSATHGSSTTAILSYMRADDRTPLSIENITASINIPDNR